MEFLAYIVQADYRDDRGKLLYVGFKKKEALSIAWQYNIKANPGEQTVGEWERLKEDCRYDIVMPGGGMLNAPANCVRVMGWNFGLWLSEATVLVFKIEV